MKFRSLALALVSAAVVSSAANASTVLVSVGVPASQGYLATNSTDFTGFTGTTSDTYTVDGLTFTAESTPTEGLASGLASSTNPSLSPSSHLGYLDIHAAGNTAFKELTLNFGAFFGQRGGGDTLLLKVKDGNTTITTQGIGGVPDRGFEVLNVESLTGSFTDVWLSVSPPGDLTPLGLSNHDAIAIDDVSASTFRTGAVPEPASWALMILGFGGVGATLRRRKLAAA